MREFRMGRNTTEYYTSFEECAKGWNCRPVKKQTKDKVKLEKQREAFGNKHLCPACKKPMNFLDGTNILTCMNESCKGIKHEITNEENNDTKVWYTTAFDLLDERGSEIANNIFAEIDN